jgi:hypothetical protein
MRWLKWLVAGDEMRPRPLLARPPPLAAVLLLPQCQCRACASLPDYHLHLPIYGSIDRLSELREVLEESLFMLAGRLWTRPNGPVSRSKRRLPPAACSTALQASKPETRNPLPWPRMSMSGGFRFSVLSALLPARPWWAFKWRGVLLLCHACPSPFACATWCVVCARRASSMERPAQGGV